MHLGRLHDDPWSRRRGHLRGSPHQRVEQIRRVEIPEPVHSKDMLDVIVVESELVRIDAG